MKLQIESSDRDSRLKLRIDSQIARLSNTRPLERQVSRRPASRIPDRWSARSPGGPPHEYPTGGASRSPGGPPHQYPTIGAPGLLEARLTNTRQLERQVSWRPASRIPDSRSARPPAGPPHQYPTMGAPGLLEARLTNTRQLERQVWWRPASPIPDNWSARSPQRLIVAEQLQRR